MSLSSLRWVLLTKNILYIENQVFKTDLKMAGRLIRFSYNIFSYSLSATRVRTYYSQLFGYFWTVMLRLLEHLLRVAKIISNTFYTVNFGPWNIQACSLLRPKTNFYIGVFNLKPRLSNRLTKKKLKFWQLSPRIQKVALRSERQLKYQYFFHQEQAPKMVEIVLSKSDWIRRCTSSFF